MLCPAPPAGRVIHAHFEQLELSSHGVQADPDLLPAWYAFSDARAQRRVVRWLADKSLIDDEAAERFLAGHPDPDLP